MPFCLLSEIIFQIRDHNKNVPESALVKNYVVASFSEMTTFHMLFEQPDASQTTLGKDWRVKVYNNE